MKKLWTRIKHTLIIMFDGRSKNERRIQDVASKRKIIFKSVTVFYCKFKEFLGFWSEKPNVDKPQIYLIS